MTCPVCKAEVDSSQYAFCPQCAWDLKNDLTLNTYLGSIPETEMSDYRQRLEIARKNWEYLQQMKERTSQRVQQQQPQHVSSPTATASPQKSASPSANVKEQAHTSGLNLGIERDPFETKEEYIKRLTEKPYCIGEAELIREDYNIETGNFPLRMVTIDDWPALERDCLHQMSCKMSRDAAVTVYQKSPRWPVYLQLVESKGELSISLKLGTSPDFYEIQFLPDKIKKDELLKRLMKVSRLSEPLVPIMQWSPPLYTELGREGEESVQKQQIFTKLGHGGVVLTDNTFQAQGWLMTLDNRSGLIWEMNNQGDQRKKYNWYDAQGVFIAGLNKMKYGGFSDWRLPKKGELNSIRTMIDPSINTKFFQFEKTSNYWSSTTFSNSSESAWGVDFNYGYVNLFNKSKSYYVRAVRADR